jgi:hypothetical protein
MQTPAKAAVVLEPHGGGYRLWSDGAFTRLVFAIPGVVRIKKASCGGQCWEVSLDPRYDAREIEAAVYELVQQLRPNPGIGRWAQ